MIIGKNKLQKLNYPKVSLMIKTRIFKGGEIVNQGKTFSYIQKFPT